jgi:hypothetical protein
MSIALNTLKQCNWPVNHVCMQSTVHASTVASCILYSSLMCYTYAMHALLLYTYNNQQQQMRRGCWELLEALLAQSTAAATATAKSVKHKDINPMFVVGCWGRIRLRMLQTSAKQSSGSSSSNAAQDAEADGR